MKIICISPSFNDGGGTVNVDKLLKLLTKKLGHKVTFVSLQAVGLSFYSSNIKLVNVDLSRLSVISSFSVIRLCLRERPSVLISNGRGGAVYSVILGCFVRKIIVIPRGFQPYLLLDRVYSKLLALFFSKKTLIIPVGDAEKNRINSCVGNKIPTRVIRNPVKNLRERAMPRDLPIIWVGRLTFEKRFDDLKRLMGCMSRQYIIYTSGQLDNFNHANSQIFNNQRFTEHLRVAGIFVSFSEREGFPTAVVEALLMGNAVILSNIDAHREIAKKPLLFEIGDTERCQTIIKRLEVLHYHGRLTTVMKRYIKIDKEIFNDELYEKAWRSVLKDHVQNCNFR